jgi:hypothetical protein
MSTNKHFQENITEKKKNKPFDTLSFLIYLILLFIEHLRDY